MLDLYHELQAIIGALDKRKIDYARCGGLAMAVYGAPRATVDIDLLILRKDLEQSRAVAKGLGYTIDALPMKFSGGDMEIHRFTKIDEEFGVALPLDFLLVTPRLEVIWGSRRSVPWQKREIDVVSPEGLVELKRMVDTGELTGPAVERAKE